MLFPIASIIYALATAFDHLLLILKTDGHDQLESRPFQFKATWIRDPGGFFTVVKG